jgi:hypothetical protein
MRHSGPRCRLPRHRSNGSNSTLQWAVLAFLPVMVALGAVGLACTAYEDYTIVAHVRAPTRLLFVLTIAVTLLALLLAKSRHAATSSRWLLASLVLLLIRQLFPGGGEFSPFVVGRLLPDAYGTGAGPWVWVALHAAGCATAARLRGRWLWFLGVMGLLCWAGAITLYLLNSPSSGQDLWIRWR